MQQLLEGVDVLRDGFAVVVDRVLATLLQTGNAALRVNQACRQLGQVGDFFIAAIKYLVKVVLPHNDVLGG